MKKILFLCFLTFSFNSFSVENCDETTGSLTDIIKITGKKCFNNETGKDDLQDFVRSAKEISEFCSHCKSEVLTNSVVDKGLDDTEIQLSKVAFDEFQKELTFISLDLMKMRSSFKINFDPKDAIKSCHFSKENLKKPTCLTNDQTEYYNQTVKNIQNSLATELSNILSPSGNSNSGLLTRKGKKNECALSDKDILYVQARYQETLFTPKLVLDLKDALKEKKGLENFLKSNDTLDKNVSILKSHPLFKILFTDAGKLKQFLGEIKSTDTQDQIIEKLYNSKLAKGFGATVHDRCKSAFEKSSEHLKNIFCSKTPFYRPEDLKSFESISGKKFSSMTEIEAETKVQSLCALVNADIKGSKPILSIRQEINDKNDQALINSPIEEFKSATFDVTFNGSKEELCHAINNKSECAINHKNSECIKYFIYEDLKKPGVYADLANASDDNINQILRSLVGDGLPQKDGKVDQSAILVLQKERILPGGTQVEVPARKATASEFHEAVRKGGPAAGNMAQGKPVLPTPVMSPSQDLSNNSANTSFSNSSADTGNAFNQPKPQSSSSIQQAKKNQAPQFSGLSDKEQNEILDRLKKSAKKEKNSDTIADEAPSFGENSQKVIDPTTFSASTSNANQVSDSRNLNPKLNNNFVGNKATIDPVKKANAVNNALIDANTNRSPASASVGSATPTLSVSKPSKDENEIKIQVAEQELSKVSEFKDKLKTLLAAHGQEISVVEDGGKIIVKLNDYKIDVKFNAQKGFYEVIPVGEKVPDEYLNTISYYFNVTLKDRSSRDQLVNVLPKVKKS